MYSEFQSEIIVRPDDIDMNNHVHFSKYLDYLLAARFDQMRKDYKMPMDEFIKRDMTWFARNITINFKRPLTLGDIAVVKTQITHYRAASVFVKYAIYKKGEEEKVCVEGTSEFTLLSTKTGRPVRIPQDVLEKYSV